uniref:Large ribosomal subunit protein mL53 n=1 Tax=Corethrella appendiculata TaxID=1370023 RepID=U5ESZ2_9DIPT
MSVKLGGGFRRSGGIVSAIAKQLKLVNMKPVKRVTVTFDPFDENSNSAREFLHHLSIPRIALTNSNFALKTNIVCDRSEPTIVFQLLPAIQETAKYKKIEFKSANLSTLELLQLCNKHVSSLAPVEEPVNIFKTKSEKRASAGGSGGGKRR